MTEEITNENVESVETPTEAPAPSLDDIANEFSVEEQVNQFQAQPQPVQEAQQVRVPDPYIDPTGYENFMRQQNANLDQFGNALNEVTQKIQNYERQMLQQKIDADVDKATTKIHEKLGIDKDLAEIAMEREYRRNPAFKKIWDNRDKNSAAFDKALDVLADKMAPTFANRVDPQLVENQRAAKASQRTMANAPKEDPNSDWSNLSQNEFEAKWSKLKGS